MQALRALRTGDESEIIPAEAHLWPLQTARALRSGAARHDVQRRGRVQIL